jgi:hypothetical protein
MYRISLVMNAFKGSHFSMYIISYEFFLGSFDVKSFSDTGSKSPSAGFAFTFFDLFGRSL